MPDSARLTDEVLGPIVGAAFIDDSINTEMDLYRYVARAIENHLWPMAYLAGRESQDEKVAGLHLSLNAVETLVQTRGGEVADLQGKWTGAQMEVYTLQEQLDAATNLAEINFHLVGSVVKERDAALAQVRALVEEFPRDDSQDWWRGYHSRDSQEAQLGMVIERQKQEITALKVAVKENHV